MMKISHLAIDRQSLYSTIKTMINKPKNTIKTMIKNYDKKNEKHELAPF